MNWDYRVIREEVMISIDLGYYENFGIAKVFYNEDGSINSWSILNDIPSCNSYEKLKETVDKYSEAFEKTILNANSNKLEE